MNCTSTWCTVHYVGKNNNNKYKKIGITIRNTAGADQLYFIMSEVQTKWENYTLNYNLQMSKIVELASIYRNLALT